MAVGDVICQMEPFVSSITPSDETTARDLEILRQEVEDYLSRLRENICTELQTIRDECCGS